MLATKLMIAAGVAAALTGCGGLRLHDKVADEIAATAKADFEAAKVQDALKAEQSAFEALEKRQIEAFLKSVSIERDLALLSVMSGGSSSLVSRLADITGQRIGEIVTDSAGSMTDDQLESVRLSIMSIRSGRRAFADASAEEAQQRSEIGRLSDQFAKLPACIPESKSVYEKNAESDMQKAVKNKDFKPSETVLNGYIAYAEACRTLLESQNTLRTAEEKITGGQLMRAAAALKKAQDDLAKDQILATAAKADLKKASSEVVSLSKASQSVGESKDFTCQAAGEAEDAKEASPAAAAQKKRTPSVRLCDALDRLEKLGDVGKKIVSEERLAKIEVLLAAASGKLEASVDGEVESSLALLDASVRFGNSLKAYRKQGKLPALEPLIIEKQLAATRLDMATKGLELRRLHVHYQRDMYDALLLEITTLFRARAQAASIKMPADNCASALAQQAPSTAADAAASGQKLVTSTPNRSVQEPACATLGEILASPKMQSQVSTWPKDGKGGSVEAVSEPALRSAYRALAYLAESYSVAKTRYRSAEMRSILLAYRESALRSEAALAAWSGLVNTPIEQVKTYYSTGLKPNEIAQFLQALGLLGIADGVR